MRPFIASAGCLVHLALLGCAPQWTRPDMGDMRGDMRGDAWAEQDERACEQEAELAMSVQPGNFYGSPKDLYGANFQPRGLRNTQWVGAPGPMFDIDPVRRTLEEGRLTDNCMRAKGYLPKG